MPNRDGYPNSSLGDEIAKSPPLNKSEHQGFRDFSSIRGNPFVRQFASGPERQERQAGPIDVLVNNAGYGISEALGKEVADFGIRVTALAPGQFRTDWAGRSLDRAPRTLADYDAVMDPIRAARQAKSGNQPGDPAKAAQALLALVDTAYPPVRLFLGDDALGLVEQKLDRMRAEIDTWDTLSRSTSFT